MMAITERPPSRLRRWLWFVALWAAGVGTVALVSLVLRAWIVP